MSTMLSYVKQRDRYLRESIMTAAVRALRAGKRSAFGVIGLIANHDSQGLAARFSVNIAMKTTKEEWLLWEREYQDLTPEQKKLPWNDDDKKD